jgi:short-subunit dehydrogenase
MDLSQARTLVAGATGVLGSGIAEALHGAGARLALAGRDQDRLHELAERLGGVPAFAFDALDLDRCAAVVDEAAEALGGLDLLVVATGIAAFGPAQDTDDLVIEQLFAVNTMAPMALVRAALPRIGKGGGVAVLSAILADVPTAGMAAYSASKAALTAWLTALRLEQRRQGRTVFDIRPPHVDTGLAGRAIAGDPPALTAAVTTEDVVRRVVDGIRDGRRELSYDLGAKEFRTR